MAKERENAVSKTINDLKRYAGVFDLIWPRRARLLLTLRADQSVF